MAVACCNQKLATRRHFLVSVLHGLVKVLAQTQWLKNHPKLQLLLLWSRWQSSLGGKTPPGTRAVPMRHLLFEFPKGILMFFTFIPA